jgi:hypothetical protein
MLNFEDLDHEFMTKGNPAADAENAAMLIKKNLTPEEQVELQRLYPYLEEASILMYKAQTGKFPEGMDADLKKLSVFNDSGVASEQPSDTEVAENTQRETMTRSEPLEGQMPKIDNKQMAEGDSVNNNNKNVDLITLADIKNQPQWLQRALDPESKTLNRQSVRTSVDQHPDGKRIMLYPLIRQSGLSGTLRKYNQQDAQTIALRKGDFIVVPSVESGNALSKEISDAIGKKRNMVRGGRTTIAAGPVGVVDKSGADNSGVADDVPTKSDGFVINAAAVEHAGLKDIYNMIKDAIEYLNENGIDIDTTEIPVSAEDILVSNGEVVIPNVIARVIGYDKLEKINNRGKKETEEKLAQQEEAPPPPPQQKTPPVLQDQMTGLT